ncbi:hypothetical protein GQ457_10G027580 [Hibiscus cannabinus]
MVKTKLGQGGAPCKATRVHIANVLQRVSPAKKENNHFEFQKAGILQHLCQVPRSKLKGVALKRHMLYG